VVVPVCELALPVPAWLPLDVVVPDCALDPPEAGWVEVGLGVGVGVGVGLVVVDVLFVWRVDVPPLELCAEVEVGVEVGVDVHLVVYVLVVLPEVFEPAADTAVGVGVGVGAGVVVADVLELVSVLEVPPFTVGVTLNWGAMVIIGSTVITGAEIALEIPLIFMARP
jgi:hypothetical protein